MIILDQRFHTHMCHEACVVSEGNFGESVLFLSTRGFQESNSGRQSWQQVSLPTE